LALHLALKTHNNPNLLPQTFSSHYPKKTLRNEQPKNTKQLIINTLKTKTMGNAWEPKKNPVAARHDPDSYPGREIKEKPNQ